MKFNHEAIYALYPNVVRINDDEGAFDKDGNKIEFDEVLVSAWTDPNEYAKQRAAEYPSFADQFDVLYHGGYDAWKLMIEQIKNKYPKP